MTDGAGDDGWSIGPGMTGWPIRSAMTVKGAGDDGRGVGHDGRVL